MEIKTKYKIGDIKWVNTNQGPAQLVITKIIKDINGIFYSSGDITAPESALSDSKPLLQFPSEK